MQDKREVPFHYPTCNAKLIYGNSSNVFFSIDLTHDSDSSCEKWSEEDDVVALPVENSLHEYDHVVIDRNNNRVNAGWFVVCVYVSVCVSLP